MRQIYIGEFSNWRYSRFMKYVHDVLDHPQRENVEKRLSIIEFCDQYGFEATKKAFGKSRSSIYLWKQKLKNGKGQLSTLVPGDRTPKNKRHRFVDPFIEKFILDYRAAHPGVDKATIAPILKDACLHNKVRPISESTVGRIIYDLKVAGKLSFSNKIGIRGGTGTLLVRQTKHKKKLRRKDFTPRQPGDLVQMDTIAIFVDGLKRYIFTAIDVQTRFAFAYTYKAKSSANGRDFLKKVLDVAPFPVKRIQTDNGGEFAMHFDDFCVKTCLTHFFNYPRHPESNGFLERFNRTIQEQHVEHYLDYIDEPDIFNRKLMDYLIWYNTEKPHRGIGKIPPMRYYLDTYRPLDQSNMLWTLTSA